MLVKVPCELKCSTGIIVQGCGREPIKHEAQPSSLFSQNHALSGIIPVMNECVNGTINCFIVVAFVVSATLNDSN